MGRKEERGREGKRGPERGHGGAGIKEKGRGQRDERDPERSSLGCITGPQTHHCLEGIENVRTGRDGVILTTDKIASGDVILGKSVPRDGRVQISDESAL